MHKWSQEVSFEKGYFVSRLWPKVSSRSSCVSVSSHSRLYQSLSDINRVNLLIAMLYFSYLRKPWKARSTNRAYHPAGLRLNRPAVNWTPPPPPQCRKPLRNTQAHDAATHLICNRMLECAFTQQQGSDSWKSLWLWLQAHINASIFVKPIGKIAKQNKMCLNALAFM